MAVGCKNSAISGLVFANALKIPPTLAGGEANCKDLTGHHWLKLCISASGRPTDIYQYNVGKARECVKSAAVMHGYLCRDKSA